MPIEFTAHPNDGFYISKSIGAITDAEMLDGYMRFFASDEWVPGMNELADISESDVTQVTTGGMENLAMLIQEIFRKHVISPKVAVYAPSDLPYGLSRMYAVFAEEYEFIEVFRNLAEARAWLEESTLRNLKYSDEKGKTCTLQ